MEGLAKITRAFAKKNKFHGSPASVCIYGYSSMNQDKDFKSRSKKWKREEGKSPFLKECYAGFSGLTPHLSGLGTGIELCWLAPPIWLRWLFFKAPVLPVQSPAS